MTVGVTPVRARFVGEVSGIDLRVPISDADFATLRAALDEYGVLIFHDQVIDDAEQTAFSKRFGELELPGAASNITKPEDRRLGPQVADLSNVDRHGHLLARESRQRLFNLGNQLWHSDSSFRAVPAQYSMLSARIVPARGGDTQFADMRAAYGRAARAAAPGIAG